MSFAEKGAVADIEPPFFIGYLHRLKATGTLKFEDAPVQRAIYFREGRVLFSSSNAPEDQLGAILVSGGKIGQEQFDALVLRLEPKQSIASALSQGGHVSQKDIGDAARRKVEQIVGACCAQTTGRYEFEDGVLPKGALDLKLTTEKVLVSAFEVLEPSGFLIRILKSPMAVLASAEVEVVDPDLTRLREALDGVSSLADIGGKVGLALAATEARAAVLVVLGAASVVTSQIEEMALPDTGETSPGLPAMTLSEESQPVEAETMAFGQSPAEAGPSLEGDSTLVIPPPVDSVLDGSGDTTLVVGSGLGFSSPDPPAESETISVSGIKHDIVTPPSRNAARKVIDPPAPAAVRPGSASIPSKRWEPVLSAQSRSSRDRRGLAGVARNSTLKRVAAVVFLAVVSVLAWIAYTASQTRPTPATPSGTPLALGTPPSPSSPLPVPSSAATAPPPAEAPSTKAAAALPTVSPMATPVATPQPIKAQAPAAAVVKATPTTRPAPGSGYEALKAGRLAEAAAAFETAAQSRKEEFSVQLLVACSAQTIEKAIQNDTSADLFVLPATISGKPCYRLMRGFFKTNSDATDSVATLPPYYIVEGAKPKVVAVKAALR